MTQSTGYYTKERRIKAAERLMLQGKSCNEIAKTLGVHRTTISRYLKHAFKPPVTDEMLSEMYRMHREIQNWAEVARQLGTTPQVINYWKKIAKQRGITP